MIKNDRSKVAANLGTTVTLQLTMVHGIFVASDRLVPRFRG